MRTLICLPLLALLVGCGTTSSGDPLYRLRPAETDLAGESRSGFTGGLQGIVSFPEFSDVGSNEFKGPESAGFRVFARPGHWLWAPELGIMLTDEHDGDFDLKALEISPGARVAARMSEVPVEFYANGGLSFLEYTLGSQNDNDLGFYAGVGVDLLLGGSNDGISVGTGYRYVSHDWDVDDWSEVFFSIGLRW